MEYKYILLTGCARNILNKIVERELIICTGDIASMMNISEDQNRLEHTEIILGGGEKIRVKEQINQVFQLLETGLSFHRDITANPSFKDMVPSESNDLESAASILNRSGLMEALEKVKADALKMQDEMKIEEPETAPCTTEESTQIVDENLEPLKSEDQPTAEYAGEEGSPITKEFKESHGVIEPDDMASTGGTVD